MVKQFLCFELFWGYEGRADDPKAVTHYYGFTVQYWFFGVIVVSLRKDSNGR